MKPWIKVDLDDEAGKDLGIDLFPLHRAEQPVESDQGVRFPQRRR